MMKKHCDKMNGKNKKADIPVTILVIGIFAICALALISFYVSMTKIKTSFVGISLVEKLNSQREEYSVYGNLEKSDTVGEEDEYYWKKVMRYVWKRVYREEIIWEQNQGTLLYTFESGKGHILVRAPVPKN